jgi:hypothetical protein
MGMYEDSLNYYNEAELQTFTEKQLPSRSLRIVAESYAIKGKWKYTCLNWMDGWMDGWMGFVSYLTMFCELQDL